MKKIPFNFLNATVMIGERLPDGSEFWGGSGFVVRRKATKKLCKDSFYLITNKHCLEKRKELLVRYSFFKKDSTSDLTITLIGKDEKLFYSPHPDEGTDVAAIMLNEKIFNKRNSCGYFDLDSQSLTLTQMRNMELYEGTPVYAMGFPLDLIDEVKSPTCVSGCISKILSTYFDKKREDDSYFIDARTYPGHSGGPVLCKTEPSPFFEQLKLIGVLKGSMEYEDYIYGENFEKTDNVEFVKSNLTQVFPVDNIRKVVELEWKRNNPHMRTIRETA